MLGRDYAGQNCSIARALEVVGERWTLLIVRDALLGYTRFDQFSERLGLAPNVLTRRLRGLEEAGVMERRRYSERPPRHEYVLTERGRALLPVALSLMAWGDAHLAPGGPPAQAHHHGCGGRLTPDARCSACDEPVDAAQVEWRYGPGASRPPGPRPVQPARSSD